MLGLMQDWPLTVDKIIDHAKHWHGSREVVTRSVEGPLHTTTYAEMRSRSLRVAKRLEKHGIEYGDRVATLGDPSAWQARFGRELNATDDRPHFDEGRTTGPSWLPIGKVRLKVTTAAPSA